MELLIFLFEANLGSNCFATVDMDEDEGRQYSALRVEALLTESVDPRLDAGPGLAFPRDFPLNFRATSLRRAMCSFDESVFVFGDNFRSFESTRRP